MRMSVDTLDTRQTSLPASGLPAAALPASALPASALVATLGLAAAGWVIVTRQMSGMDMGVATRLGSLGFFIGVWVSMMAAMMLAGMVPVVLRRAHVTGQVRSVPLFVASYLAVWTLVGLAVYAVYRPHGTDLAGALVIAAGLYELTPLMRGFRLRCQQSVHSGIEYGLNCLGSSAGLMLTLVAVSVMSLGWMTAMAVVVIAQKLLPAKAAFDAAAGLGIVTLGVLILAAPSTIPGLMPAM
jgi:predicted metal-binding membrane protein